MKRLYCSMFEGDPSPISASASRPPKKFTATVVQPSRFLIGALVSVLSTLSPSLGWCARPDAARNLQAEALFVEGRNLLKANRVSQACEKFAASQSLDPAVGTLLNLADCHERINKTATAWAEFREAAALAGAAQDDKRKRLAASRANALTAKLARLRITTTSSPVPKDFGIRLDDEDLPAASWNTDMPIDPGSHTVVAKASGFGDWSAEVMAVPSKVEEVIIAPLQAKVVASGPAAQAEAHVTESDANLARATTVREEGPKDHTSLWVAGGIAAGSVVVGSLAGAIAYKKWDGVSSQCRSNGSCTSGERSGGDAANTWGTISTVAFAAAGVAAAVTGVLWWSHSPRKESSLALAPWLQQAGGGAALLGRF